VILHEFHVAQRNAVAERHAHTVAGDDTAVGVVAVNAACAASGHDHRVSTDLYACAFHHIDGNDAAYLAFIDQNIEDKMLVESFDLRVFQRGLEQSVQHVEAGFIGRKPRTFDLHSAKAANVD
jgi:hypothetical protein